MNDLSLDETMIRTASKAVRLLAGRPVAARRFTLRVADNRSKP